MRKNPASQSGFFNPRNCLALLLCLGAVSIAVLSFASMTVSGVTLSPAAINFGYQLVGTTGSQFVETVTNSGTGPLVITDISVSGRDHHNFVPTYNFSLPVTVA